MMFVAFCSLMFGLYALDYNQNNKNKNYILIGIIGYILAIIIPLGIIGYKLF